MRSEKAVRRLQTGKIRTGPGRFFTPAPVQAKHRDRDANDVHEREADRIAEQVTSEPAANGSNRLVSVTPVSIGVKRQVPSPDADYRFNSRLTDQPSSPHEESTPAVLFFRDRQTRQTISAEFSSRKNAQKYFRKPASVVSDEPSATVILKNILLLEFLLPDNYMLTIGHSKPIMSDETHERENRDASIDTGLSFKKAKQRAFQVFGKEYISEMRSFARDNISLATRHSGKVRRAFGKLEKISERPK